MRFYTGQHRHYCGIDLHVRTMYVCILDATGQVLLHRNLPAKPEAFLEGPDELLGLGRGGKVASPRATQSVRAQRSGGCP